MKQSLAMLTLLTLVSSLVGCENFSKMNTDKTAMSNQSVLEPTMTNTSSPIADTGYSAVMPVASQPVPAIDLPDLFTQKMITNADLPKKPYLINFWASWNEGSKAEQPFLLQLAKQSVPIVGVNFKDDTADALNYLKVHQNPFVFSVQDKEGWFSHMGLTGIPESFLVDSNNKVRLHIWGEINQEKMDKYILPCLNELNKNVNETTIKKVCQ